MACCGVGWLATGAACIVAVTERPKRRRAAALQMGVRLARCCLSSSKSYTPENDSETLGRMGLK